MGKAEVASEAEAQEPRPWQRSLALFPAEVLADVVVFIPSLHVVVFIRF